MIQSIRIANEMALLEKEARRYCDRKNNRVSLKVPRLALKTNYEGFELSEPKHPFEHLYEKRRERDRTKLDRIHYNKSNYFGPIEERLEQSRDAIHLYSDNKKEEAINLFIKVVEESLSVIKTPQLYFNLGKVLLEEGYSQGIFYLVVYALHVDNGDWYGELIREWFPITVKHDRISVILPDGQILNILIESDIYKLDDNIPEIEPLVLPLHYKTPISLRLEREDKDLITYLDYKYLHRIYDQSDISIVYEIMIPKSYFPVFYQEFMGTIEQMGNYSILTDFDALYLECYIHELKMKFDHPYHFDSNGQEPKLLLMKEVVSILTINLPLELEEGFIESFRYFLDKFVTQEKSDEEMDADEDQYIEDEMERMGEEFELLNDYAVKMQFSHEYSYYQTMGELFAELGVVDDNLCKGIENPYETKNIVLNQQLINDYMELFENIFDEFKLEEKLSIVQHQPKDDIEQLIQRIRDLETKNVIAQRISSIKSVITVDPPSALSHMRVVLEVIMKKLFLKLRREITYPNGNAIELDKLMGLTRNDRPKLIDNAMYNIKSKANTVLHFTALQEKNNIPMPLVDKENALQLYDSLKKVMRYYIDNHGL
ncbi:hypothetical protein NST84_03440 [Paenibacillus sp. FSL R7-0345]|uniref:hypothetical protein n=1 Tax=Paenibacillus sp. FSL R7-0345 TaxID=2954535 RepID=UPI00315A6FF2